jgi:cellulose synthase/poly-beta-1,6-N-acetylglucosamine synthase-like glycosyltransferase
MNEFFLLSSVVFAICVSGIGCAFIVYPIILGFTRLIRGQRPIIKAPLPWSVSLITIVRGPAGSARRKAENSLSLEAPSENFECIMFWDGGGDVEKIRAAMPVHKRLVILASSGHTGKNDAINQAIERSSGQVLVFSDADVLLDREAITRLLQPLADPAVGGVCGQLVVQEDSGVLSRPQHTYWQFDRLMKTRESELGSITSNTGVLYAIRRELFQPIPLAVTDDLYACLNVVRQHKRFVFEPAALATMTAASKTPEHELRRRRRIVCRSLRGIWLSREVLNPFRYGVFSVGLFLNKVLRRFLPVMLLLILLSSAAMAVCSVPMRVLLLIQLMAYASLVPLRILAGHLPVGSLPRRLIFLAFYFCAGMVGTWLGLVDFLKGKQIVKWETTESSASPSPSRMGQARRYWVGGIRNSCMIGPSPGPDTEALKGQRARLQSACRVLRGSVESPPLVSVVIPVHVREDMTRFRSAIESLLACENAPATEIVIVLNGKASTNDLLNSPLYRLASDIGLPVFVLSYLDEERYRNIERPQNIFAAKQLGFEKARGDLVVAADLDCRFSPLWIASYVEYFNTHPDSPAAYGPVQLLGVGSILGRMLAWISTSVKAFKILLDFPPFAGHNHAFRKTVCEQMPGLYERIVVDCQELPPLLRKELAPGKTVTGLVQCVPGAINATCFSAGKIKSPVAALGWFIENTRRNVGNYWRSRRA